jgi:two-component system sensor histidine kinase/response regulator
MADACEILVVDDIAAIRNIIVQQLRTLGYSKIQTASNGDEALRILNLCSPKLIITDWSMPVMNGLELLLAVRQDPRLKDIPVIIVSAEMQRDYVMRAIQAGVKDFLFKPFKPEELARKVRNALTNSYNTPNSPDRNAEMVGSKSEHKRPTVLVVDDTPFNLKMVAGLLQDQYQIKVSANGQRAIAVCQTAAPDLVLLDVMMPEIDGFEVCRRLKADPRTAHVPIIFLTAIGDADKIAEGFELGAVDYVTKPIEPVILKARVAAAIRISLNHEHMREKYDLLMENSRLREEVERIAHHDIKNPLAIILGHTAAFSDDSALSDEQRGKIKMIEQSTYEILQLIDLSNDLLKIEQGRYILESKSVDLSALVRRVCEENQKLFMSKDVVVEAKCSNDGIVYDEFMHGELMQGEQLLLYSMLHNLIKNAAEASNAGDRVSCELIVSDVIEIRVHNPGRVPSVVEPRFFEKYLSHGKARGTGLGTYSAKLIAEAHGGAASMQSSDEEGTVVTLHFPRQSSV